MTLLRTARPRPSGLSTPRRPGAARLAALALVLAGAPLAAQEAGDAAEAPGGGIDVEAPVADGGDAGDGTQSYILEESQDWRIVCVQTSLEHDPCVLNQVLTDEGGNPTATVEIINLPNQEAEAGVTITTPLQTLLSRQITMSVDGSGPRQIAFTYCLEDGCRAQVGFSTQEINAFRRGNEAVLRIFPLVAPDQPVDLRVSLLGFTAGFARIEELNALNAEAAAAARAAQE
jgi:invasion protein IalB